MLADIIVYLVDDDPDDQYLVKKSLSKVSGNVEVMSFESGIELASYIQNKADMSSNSAVEDYVSSVALIDLNMPIMDGINTVREIRKISTVDPTAIAILTTSDNPSDMKKSYEVGADMYLIKAENIHLMADQLDNMIRFVLNKPLG